MSTESTDTDPTQPGRPIRVLLADDQPLLLRALATILGAEDDIEVVATASDGLEAIEVVSALRIDVAVLDIRMPRLDGIRAAEHLRERSQRPGIVMLTTFDDDELVRAALEAGADAFLLKDSEPDELAAAVRLVHAGQSVLSAGITGHVVRAFREAVAGGAVELAPEVRQGLALVTARELEVLRTLADGASNGEIALRLHIGDETVKTHVSNLLGKLHARDRVALVVLAHRTGIASA